MALFKEQPKIVIIVARIEDLQTGQFLNETVCNRSHIISVCVDFFKAGELGVKAPRNSLQVARALNFSG